MWPARGMPGRGVTPMRWKQGCHGTVRPELSKSCLTVIGAQIPAGKAGWGREALISCRAKEGYQTGLAWEWGLLAGLSSVRMRCTGAQGAGRGLSICPVGPLLDLQGKVELWVGGGWGLGKVQLGVFYHWVGFLSLGGIQGLWRKWPPTSGQAFFFFALVLATLAFSRGSISTHRPSWLARRGHDSTTHPQQGQPGPGLPVPLWAGLLEENSTQALLQNRKLLSLLPGGQELSPWQLWDKEATLTLPRTSLAWSCFLNVSGYSFTRVTGSRP